MPNFNPHNMMDPNPVVRFYNGEYYLFTPTNIVDGDGYSYGTGGTVRKLTPEENPRGTYNQNNTFRATIDPETWVRNGTPSDASILDNMRQSFMSMDPSNTTGWQSYFEQNKTQLLQKGKDMWTQNPGDLTKAGGFAWNDFRNTHLNQIAQLQAQNNPVRPEFTSQYQGEVYGKTGQLINTSDPAADQAAVQDYSNRMQAWHDDYGIVSMADNPSQLYWVDNKTKVAQPFQSVEAAAAFLTKTTGQTYTAADIQGAVTTVGHDFFNIAGINLQSGTSGLITNSGNNPITQTNPPAYSATGNSSSTSPTTYGATPSDSRNTSGWSMVLGLLDVFAKSGVSAQTIDKIKKDPNELALMTSAITYGGYAPADIFRELKRYEGIANGDSSLSSLVAIDPAKSATEFKKSPGYSAMVNDARLKVPAKINDIDSSTLELPVYQLPDDVFNNLQKGFDIKSPEFQAEMEKVKTLLYDAQDQLLSAQTQRDYQVAQANYAQLQADISKNYGIQLSNNAFDAFGQIESVGKQASAAGIYGSGIMDEAIDKTLAMTRKNDQLQRNNQLEDADKTKATYYQTKATPAEIAALSPADRARYGLTPSQEAINFYSIENLRKQYPDTPDDILRKYADSIIDTSTGTPTYRSDLWGTMYSNKLSNFFSKRDYQEQNVLDKYKTADELQNRKYDFSDPFNSKPTQYELDNTSTMPKTMTNGNNAAANAAGSIANNLNSSDQTTTQFNSSTGMLEKVPVNNGSSSGSTGSTNPVPAGTTRMKNKFGDIVDIPNGNVQISLNSGYVKV